MSNNAVDIGPAQGERPDDSVALRHRLHTQPDPKRPAQAVDSIEVRLCSGAQRLAWRFPSQPRRGGNLGQPAAAPGDAEGLRRPGPMCSRIPHWLPEPSHAGL